MATTSPSGGPRLRPSSSRSADTPSRPVLLAIAGNPNSGKTSLFNALTGLRRKVANYPGVTVERVEGAVEMPDGTRVRLIDLPGCYSLVPHGEDEQIARNVLLGLDPRLPRPDVLIVVVDASNLERNLFLATQLLETGVPMLVALNMVDVAERRKTPVDAAALEAALRVPVVPVVARAGENVDAIKAAIPRASSPGRLWRLPPEAEAALETLARALEGAGGLAPGAAQAQALTLLTAGDPAAAALAPDVRQALEQGLARMAAADMDATSLEAECRYALCREVAGRVRRAAPDAGPTRSERVDRWITHRVLGPLVFLAIMATMFWAVFAWAEPLMGGVETATAWLGGFVGDALGAGMLTDLLVDGVIAGVGNVVIFLPQICLLFLFLAVLEDLGYMARAAFIVDRVMRAAGLSGKSFVPLMSSFACAIPGIMSTRTIENRRDRFVTILVAPLMSCSARLPVYALLIAAFVPSGYRTGTLLGLYALSIGSALVVAWLLRKTLFRGEASSFLLELPPYRRPALGGVARTVAARGGVFLRQAGTIILAISVVLWFLAYFPRSDEVAAQAEQRVAAGEDPDEVANWAGASQLEQSWAGRLGHAIEPAIEPLGYDWKTGVGLIASFAAREVMVSTLGIVYSVGEADEESIPLRQRMAADRRPDGSPVFTTLSALSLLVFFVLACQCMSTVAVVKRETNSWRWPLFMVAYMTVLAYVGALAVYQGGVLLGYGP